MRACLPRCAFLQRPDQLALCHLCPQATSATPPLVACPVCGRVVLGDVAKAHWAACAALQAGRERRRLHRGVEDPPQQQGVSCLALDEARGGNSEQGELKPPASRAAQPQQRLGGEQHPAASPPECGRRERLQGTRTLCWCCDADVCNLTLPAPRRVAAGPVPAHRGAGAGDPPMTRGWSMRRMANAGCHPD